MRLEPIGNRRSNPRSIRIKKTWGHVKGVQRNRTPRRELAPRVKVPGQHMKQGKKEKEKPKKEKQRTASSRYYRRG